MRLNRHTCFRRPVVLFVTCLITALGIVGFVSLRRDDNQYIPWYKNNAPCSISPEQQTDMVELAARIHKVFGNLKIRHFACYGTLWGILRYENLLAWDNNIDFCAINEDIIKHDENWLFRMFKKYNIQGSYNNWEGAYDVRYGQAFGKITLFQFEVDDEMGRLGMERKVYPSRHLRYHVFPSWMVKAPLPLGQLRGVEIPVPRGEADIMKHHYPDDWWNEVKPKGCK